MPPIIAILIARQNLTGLCSFDVTPHVPTTMPVVPIEVSIECFTHIASWILHRDWTKGRDLHPQLPHSYRAMSAKDASPIGDRLSGYATCVRGCFVRSGIASGSVPY